MSGVYLVMKEEEGPIVVYSARNECSIAALEKGVVGEVVGGWGVKVGMGVKRLC